MLKLYKQLTKFADSMFKMVYIKFWVGDYKAYSELTKKLDTINPNWIQESPQNMKEYLELLISLYDKGYKSKTVLQKMPTDEFNQYIKKSFYDYQANKHLKNNYVPNKILPTIQKHPRQQA